MHIMFLGTSSMVPTKERSHNAIFVTYKEHGILIDCGEGTQRQMKIAGIKPTKVTMILITHWHGDHSLGLPGLIQTLGACEYRGTLKLFGPPGSREHMAHLRKAFIFEEKMDLEVLEVTDGVCYENDDILIESALLEHSTTCVGYAIKEKDKRRFDHNSLQKHGLTTGPHFKKLEAGEAITWHGKKITADDVSRVASGKKITIIMDTRYCAQAVALANKSSVLICEATFTADMQEKALRYKHMTAHDAARLANESQSKQLILTHFSQRYKDASVVQREAKEHFKHVAIAHDFMELSVR